MEYLGAASAVASAVMELAREVYLVVVVLARVVVLVRCSWG